MRFIPTVILALLFCVCVPAQNSPGEYSDPDAYEIYSLLLPREQSYGFAKGTLVIQQETLPVKLDDCGFAPEAVTAFKDAIEDYKRRTEPMFLQRKFEIENPYELVDTETIGTLINDYNWNDFYKRYPDSGGVIRMSAVGFNRQKTLAIVYMGSTCGSQCGLRDFHLLKKIDGRWKLAPGVRCGMVS